MNSFHTIYINLDRSTDRNSLMQAQFAQLHWEAQRWPGIDGKRLGPESLALYSAVDALLTQGRPMSLGEIGCFLSHRGIWQFVLSNNHAYCLVMEDDVIFDERLRAACTEVIQGGREFDYVNFKSTGKKAPVASDSRLVRFLTPPSAASCYLLSARGAQRLLAQSLPIRAALDGFMAEFSSGIDRFGIQEDIVEYRNLPSDIRDMSLPGKFRRRAALMRYGIAAVLCRHGRVDLAKAAHLIDPPDRVPF